MAGKTPRGAAAKKAPTMTLKEKRTAKRDKDVENPFKPRKLKRAA